MLIYTSKSFYKYKNNYKLTHKKKLSYCLLNFNLIINMYRNIINFNNISNLFLLLSPNKIYYSFLLKKFLYNLTDNIVIFKIKLNNSILNNLIHLSINKNVKINNYVLNKYYLHFLLNIYYYENIVNPVRIYFFMY